MTIEGFTDRRHLRDRETVHWFAFPDAPPPDMRAQFTPDELRRATRALERYKRHTVDISQAAPLHVEAELLAFEVGWRRAKYVGMLVLGLGLGVCFGYWVLPGWVH